MKDDFRMLSAKLILGDELLDKMPNLKEAFLVGKYFGTAYNLTYTDSTEGLALVFDFERNAYTLTERQHIKYASKLLNYCIKRGHLNKYKGIEC